MVLGRYWDAMDGRNFAPAQKQPIIAVKGLGLRVQGDGFRGLGV